jgi:Raf kinase inhibitor-like YbhB/YbcL family protein
MDGSLPKLTAIFIFLILVVVLVAGTLIVFLPSKKSLKTSPNLIQETNMRITSPAFENYQLIPAKYTCDGQDINPVLVIEGVPEKAKSLVLIMDDPDSPSGDFTHWLVWNIDPQTKEIKEDSVPASAVLGMTDFGKPGYGGPCPGSGTHRYFFKLYALDIVLDLKQGAKKSDLEKAMTGHILAQAELIGKYGRTK